MIKRLAKLFYIFFKIGAFTFGGGYAMLPLIQREIVETQHWLEEEEFLDIIAIVQTIPGAIAVNSSVFIGYKLSGIIGAIFATLGAIIPSFVVILLIATFFANIQDAKLVQAIFSGIRPAVASLIFIAAFKLGRVLNRNLFNILIISLSIIAIAILDIHPILVIISAGTLGLIRKMGGEESDN